ncbi:MAG: DUF4919 domain-containing protein [Bacteroidaceae bacterium]|nr:DUF4919 domain-containing protein [Bacteroidaceae bacterium]
MRKIDKIDYSKYKDSYDEKVNEQLHHAPSDIELESMRAYIYGYTFTEGYAKGVFPDEMSMDYWSEQLDELGEETEFDLYEVETKQERKLLEAIDSTGDGKTPETALCVISVGQEYEYLQRVFPYSILTVKQQSFSNGIDCLEFEENAFGVERIFFDISRRFEVGYGM